jgi:hypothetical protein
LKLNDAFHNTILEVLKEIEQGDYTLKDFCEDPYKFISKSTMGNHKNNNCNILGIVNKIKKYYGIGEN